MYIDGYLRTENNVKLLFVFETYKERNENGILKTYSKLFIHRRWIGESSENYVKEKVFMEHMFNDSIVDSINTIIMDPYESESMENYYSSSFEVDYEEYDPIICNYIRNTEDFKTMLTDILELTSGYKKDQSNNILDFVCDELDGIYSSELC